MSDWLEFVIGEAFFAWSDTLPQQWSAIGGFNWR